MQISHLMGARLAGRDEQVAVALRNDKNLINRLCLGSVTVK